VAVEPVQSISKRG